MNKEFEKAIEDCYKKILFRKQTSTDTFKQHVREAFKEGVKWTKKRKSN